MRRPSVHVLCLSHPPEPRRSPTTATGPHTPGVLGLLVELLLDPPGVVDQVRDRRRERRIRRRARAARIPCALRVVDGAHRGLGRRWTRGTARVPPGTL